MPDKRKHRGPHPDDAEQFAPKYLDDLRSGLTHRQRQAELKQTDRVVVTSDSVILDHCRQCGIQTQVIVSVQLPQTSVIELARGH